MHKVYILLGFLNIIVCHVTAQKQDHIWVTGYDYDLSDFDSIPVNYGMINIDFNQEPLQMVRKLDRVVSMNGANSSLCDSEGELIAYSNGQVIIGKDEEVIEDTINYAWDQDYWCREWEYNNLGDVNSAFPIGNLALQNVLILPMNDTLTFVFYNSLDYCREKWDRFWYAAYTTDSVSGFKKLLFRDSIILQQDIHHAFTAVRHANGRDWWLVIMSSGTHDIITILVTVHGIDKINPRQTNPYAIDTIAVGQVVASPDGTKLAWYAGLSWTETGGVWVVSNFDRCTGYIDILAGKIVQQPTGIGGAVEFSYDNKHLFISNGQILWQYNLKREDILASEEMVAAVDSFIYEVTPDFWVGANFCTMKLGPDGRIYIFPSNGSGYYFGVIDFPDESGVAAQVRQHAFRSPVIFRRTVPNMPTYRLGPLDGSSCDTLGLDNYPIAKYRYEPDSIDYKRIRFTDLSYFRPETWSWDFGDGSPKISQRSPHHTYAQNGTYRVCLTVSNENSSHTFCRDITLGTSAVSDESSGPPIEVNIFPNPVQDILLVTLGEYIPERGYIELYNISGQQVHKQRAYYGHNNVDMSGLQAGTYVLRFMDGNYLIKEEKVVKVD